MDKMERLAAKFGEMDIIVVVDTSASMNEDDMPGGRSRWVAMQENVVDIVRTVSKIDSDGIGFVTFGGAGITSEDGVGVERVKELFASKRPSGGTPLAEGLSAALKLAGKSDKKDMIIVFTDGVPDDKAAAASVIVDASKKLNSDDELTFLFIPVGYNKDAEKWLTGLDDNLTGAKFDIVDVKTMAEVDAFPSILELLDAAIEG